MDLLPYAEQDMLIGTAEDFCLLPLLERGLRFARQGRYHESMSIFRFIREHLSPDQQSLIALLDTLLLFITQYQQAQYALQQASKRFVEADTTQQAHIEALARLL